MFLAGDGKPAHDAVRNWVHGFWKAMALAPQVWSALAEDERMQAMIAPFVGFVDLGEQAAFELRDDADAVLDADAAAIPQTVLVLRKLAQIRRRPPVNRRSGATIRAPAAPGESTSAAAAPTEASTSICRVIYRSLTRRRQAARRPAPARRLVAPDRQAGRRDQRHRRPAGQWVLALSKSICGLVPASHGGVREDQEVAEERRCLCGT